MSLNVKMKKRKMSLQVDYEYMPKYVDLWCFIKSYIFFNILHHVSNDHVFRITIDINNI